MTSQELAAHLWRPEGFEGSLDAPYFGGGKTHFKKNCDAGKKRNKKNPTENGILAAHDVIIVSKRFSRTRKSEPSGQRLLNHPESPTSRRG